MTSSFHDAWVRRGTARAAEAAQGWECFGEGGRKGFRISEVSPCSKANRLPWNEEKG